MYLSHSRKPASASVRLPMDGLDRDASEPSNSGEVWLQQ